MSRNVNDNIAEYYGITNKEVAEVCHDYIDMPSANQEFKEFLNDIMNGVVYSELYITHRAWLADLAPDFEKCANKARRNNYLEAKQNIEPKGMSKDEIRNLTAKLESEDPFGGYVSRRTIYQNAMKSGKIGQAEYQAAAKFYGSLWEYVGD